MTNNPKPSQTHVCLSNFHPVTFLTNRSIRLCMVFFFCILPVLEAQDRRLRFGQLSYKDGLSQSVVMCSLQDRIGFMWFGTQDGLNLYDGYRFRVYKHNPDDPNSISGNWIQALYEDRKGDLWVGTTAGLNRFDRETERFEPIPAFGIGPHWNQPR